MARFRWLLPVTIATTACTAVLGVRDLSYDPNAATGGEGGSSGGPEAGGGDANGGDANGGCGDTASDPKNCGRCGRDCLGAACSAGACADTVLAQGLENPNAVFVDATYVYMTLYTAGSVVRVKKTGGAVDVLASGQTSAHGVTADATHVYWSNGDFSADDAGTYVGGVWKCVPATCAATKSLVTAGDWAYNVGLANGVLYFAENNAVAVTRVKTDGSGRASITNIAPKPFDVAADDTHIYFNDNYEFLQRTLLDGGNKEDFAAFGASFKFKGYIATDATGVYYTFTDSAGKGQALRAPKDSIGAPKTVYGTDNDPTDGIAVDDTWVYWATGKLAPNGDPDGTGGELRACKKTGCDPSGPIVLLKASTGGVVAADGKAVYFAESGVYGQPGGRLHVVARP